jgi:hypothetical protein
VLNKTSQQRLTKPLKQVFQRIQLFLHLQGEPIMSNQTSTQIARLVSATLTAMALVTAVATTASAHSYENRRYDYDRDQCRYHHDRDYCYRYWEERGYRYDFDRRW